MEDLTALAITWIAVFVTHFAAAKTKLTPVLWFLAIGCLLVNVGILPREPGVFMQDFAEIGIIVIMFALGFEANSSEFIRNIKRRWGIALFGAIVPFALAYSLVMYFWGDRNGALMCALAMTATAVSLTMVSLRSEDLHKTRAATGIMTSAVLVDIASLALVAVLVALLGHEFGFHAAIGAYMTGLVLKEAYFIFGTHTAASDLTIHRDIRRIIDSIAFSWIGPVFFIVLGTRLVLDLDILLLQSAGTQP